MSSLDIVQQRVKLVLERMIEMTIEDPDNADMFSEMLSVGLDDLHGCDAFGTEGQCDPRGDFREGNWSMLCVQDIDEPDEDDSEDDDY